jgi:DNA-binding GntR family transcriptional regulator
VINCRCINNEILRNRIKTKEWQVSQLIPSEPELMLTYEVSRDTVRQVLDMLVNDGLIYRQRVKGSFVASPTLEHSMAHIVSFTEDMQQRGLQPGTKVLRNELLSATEDVAKNLQVEPGTEMTHYERLRLANMSRWVSKNPFSSQYGQRCFATRLCYTIVAGNNKIYIWNPTGACQASYSGYSEYGACA